MNRSEVNEILRQGSAFIRSFGYVMPPFADWEPDRMRRAPQDAPDIVSRRLGWDVTDFGQGRFDNLGLFLFTVRNGNAADLGKGRGMLYAEKSMISRNNQYSPMHRHNHQGGGHHQSRRRRRWCWSCFRRHRWQATDPEAVVDRPATAFRTRCPQADS